MECSTCEKKGDVKGAAELLAGAESEKANGSLGREEAVRGKKEDKEGAGPVSTDGGMSMVENSDGSCSGVEADVSVLSSLDSPSRDASVL